MSQDIPWSKELGVAITVTDSEANIIFMNDKSSATFAKWGGAQLVGQSVLGCHSPSSQEAIHQLLQSGGSHTYTIEKGDQRKLIHQCAWTQDGQIGGLVELSIELPSDMPHHVRTPS